MESVWVIVTIALVGLAPAIGSVWWLVRSRHAEQRHLEAMNRMLATYPPGPPPVLVEEPPLIVVRPRRPALPPPLPYGRHARLD